MPCIRAGGVTASAAAAVGPAGVPGKSSRRRRPPIHA